MVSTMVSKWCEMDFDPSTVLVLRFEALPGSITVPVYPRHSAGEVLLWETRRLRFEEWVRVALAGGWKRAKLEAGGIQIYF